MCRRKPSRPFPLEAPNKTVIPVTTLVFRANPLLYKAIIVYLYDNYRIPFSHLYNNNATISKKLSRVSRKLDKSPEIMKKILHISFDPRNRYIIRRSSYAKINNVEKQN